MQRERDERARAQHGDSLLDGTGAAPARRPDPRAHSWNLPLSLQDGRPRKGRPDPLVDTARLVLEVVPGERRLLPGFGCRIHDLPRIESEAERHLAAVLVEESLATWVPSLRVERAEVLDVDDDLVDLALRVSGDWHRLRVRHRHEADDGSRSEEPQRNESFRARRGEDNVR